MAEAGRPFAGAGRSQRLTPGAAGSVQDALLLAEAIHADGAGGETDGIDAFIAVRRPYIGAFQDAQQPLGSAFWPGDGAPGRFHDRCGELSLGQAGLRQRWRG